MKRVSAVVLSLLGLFCFLILESKTPEEKFFYSQIKKILNTQDQSIPLKNLTNFEWEKAYYARPYTQNNSNTFLLDGKEYLLPSNTKIDLGNDGLWALFFIQSNKITAIIHSKSFFIFPLKRYFLTYNPKINQNYYYPNDTLIVEENTFQLRKDK